MKRKTEARTVGRGGGRNAPVWESGPSGYGGGYGGGYNQGGCKLFFFYFFLSDLLYIKDGGYGGYGQNNYQNQGWNQGGGGGGGGQGGWSSDYGNSGYGTSYGGGPIRGGNNYSHRSGGPYGGKTSWT